MFISFDVGAGDSQPRIKRTRPYSLSFTCPISFPSILSYMKGIDDEYGDRSVYISLRFSIGNIFGGHGSGWWP
jgi:hypothetical protein